MAEFELEPENDAFKSFPVRAKVASRTKPQPKKRNYKPLLVTVSVLLVLSTVSILSCWYGNKHEFDWQSPLLIKRRVVKTISPTIERVEAKELEPVAVIEAPKPLTRKAPIPARKNGMLPPRIHQLESEHGHTDPCTLSGKVNGFGYAQNTSQWVCYDSFEQVLTKVETRVAELIALHGVPKALCMYNTGHATTTCKYYQNYLNVNI